MPDALTTPGRRRLWAEVAIVLGLSLGASAVYSIVAIVYRLTRAPLSQQTTTLNTSRSSVEWLDFTYQLLGVVFDLVPVALVCYLLWNTARPHLSRLGLTLDRPGRDAGYGTLLFIAVGIPGAAAYLGSVALGINTSVAATSLDTYYWWSVPMLLLAAARAAIQEEVIVVGYLTERLRAIGWGRWQIILGSALFRGSYHLYQGFGGFIGNVVMGIAFGWLYARYGRLLPLLVTHFLLDAAVFVGYPWAAEAFPGLLG